MARRLVPSIVTVAVLMCSTPAAGHAWLDEHRTMQVTFSTAVALPGVALAPGTYVFELAAPRTDPTIVRVLSSDRSTVYFTAFTESVPRPAGPRGRPVTFGEAAPGRPVPITVWYPEGQSNGRRFLYRGNRARVAGLAELP